ncbi:MAG: hypothetical protein WDM85_03305 [Caulobacteraceae bacterium]
MWKITSPSAAATARPAKVVIRIAAISRAERTASHSIRTMAATATIVIGKARSARLPNSSSSSGTGRSAARRRPGRGPTPGPWRRLGWRRPAAAPGSSWA